MDCVISNSLQGYDSGTAGAVILLVFLVDHGIERIVVRVKKSSIKITFPSKAANGLTGGLSRTVRLFAVSLWGNMLDDILRCWKASRLEKREKRPKDRITDLCW